MLLAPYTFIRYKIVRNIVVLVMKTLSLFHYSLALTHRVQRTNKKQYVTMSKYYSEKDILCIKTMVFCSIEDYATNWVTHHNTCLNKLHKINNMFIAIIKQTDNSRVKNLFILFILLLNTRHYISVGTKSN